MDLTAWQIEQMAAGRGCENCGSEVAGKTLKGHKHCGNLECIQQLQSVEISTSIPLLTDEELEEVLGESL